MTDLFAGAEAGELAGELVALLAEHDGIEWPALGRLLVFREYAATLAEHDLDSAENRATMLANALFVIEA